MWQNLLKRPTAIHCNRLGPELGCLGAASVQWHWLGSVTAYAESCTLTWACHQNTSDPTYICFWNSFWSICATTWFSSFHAQLYDTTCDCHVWLRKLGIGGTHRQKLFVTSSQVRSLIAQDEAGMGERWFAQDLAELKISYFILFETPCIRTCDRSRDIGI